MEFKVVCIDDKNRPNDIPLNKWIREDEVYTVIKADYMLIQNRILGFKIAEIDISDCYPYTYFSASRFRPLTKLDVEAAQAVKQLLEETYANIQ